MTSIIKACLQCIHIVSDPICHFRVLNPHMENSEFSMTVMDCFQKHLFYTQANNHVSSFGFGGTNVHCLFWGERKQGEVNTPSLWMKRIRQMAPPEVRVIGSSPDEWECDIPDADCKREDKWVVNVDPDDPKDAPISWIKEEQDPDDDDENASFAIVGNFNDWEADMM